MSRRVFGGQVIGKGAFGKVMMVRMVGDAQRRVYAMKVGSCTPNGLAPAYNA
jgi:hypothetical protein